VSAGTGDAGLALVCSVGGRPCALPLAQVVETTPALPLQRVAGLPDFVAGVAIVRGAPVPVLDAARLLHEGDAPHGRWVVLRVDGRHVALAVEGVRGVRRIEAAERHALPPLLGDGRADAIAGLALLDEQLVLVLRQARLLTEDEWTRLDAVQAPAPDAEIPS